MDIINPEYNILKIAGSRFGHKVSSETKDKLRIALTGRKHTKEIIEKLRKINRIVTDETLLKLASRSLGVKVKIFDFNQNLSYHFSTIGNAAKFLKVKPGLISKILNNNLSYKNLVFEFEMKRFRIEIFNLQNKLISTYNVIKTVSRIYNIPFTTLIRYINTNKPYKNMYYFRKSYY
jgi:hypothetical protein